MAKEIIIDINIQGTKDVLRLQDEIKALKKEIRDTEKDTPVYDELVEKLVKAQAELVTARKDARQFRDEVIAQDKANGAYDRLSAKLRVSRKRLKDLAADGKTATKEFRDLTQQVQKLDTRLKGIDASVGQFQRNVGNYSGALRLAGRQTREFVRTIGGIPPAANLAVGAFAVLGNLPQIFEQFNQIVDSIDKYISSFTVAGRLNQRFGETFDEVIDGFIEEKAQIDSLVKAATDETLSKEQQIAARQKLEEISGVTLTNIEDETQLLEQLKVAQEEATEALIDNTIQQARANLVADITKEIVENERDRLQQSRDLQDSFLGQGLNKFSEFVNSSGDVVERFAKVVNGQAEETTKFTDRLINDARNSSRNLLQEELQNLDLILSPLRGVLEESITAVGDFSGAAKGTVEDLDKELDKNAERSRKKRIAEAKKAAQQLQKAREKALADQLKLEQANAAALLKLQDQFLDAEIKNIQDEETRRIAEINRSFEKRTSARAANFEKLKAQAEKQEQELIKLFGEGSTQVLAFRQRNAQQTFDIQQEINALEVEEEKRKQQQILDVQEDFAQKRFNERLKNVKAERTAIERELTNELNRIEQIRAEGQITQEQAEKQSFERRKQAILDQLVALEKQRMLLNESELEDIDNQIDQIVSKRQSLNTQLAKLEEGQTAKVQEETQKRAQSQIKTIDAINKTFNDALGFADQFAQGLQQRQEQRFQFEQEQQQNRLDALNERLNKATGLEKKFLQKRVQEETAAANEIAAAQERAQRRAARTQKAIAIAQAAINGALAVTKILLQTTDFTPVQAFRAAAVAGAIATTAAQIAIITAQPLATGGVVGKNIKGKPISRSNGDDTLTTLKTGEVVLNKTQQARLGGAKTFRSIGVPGFATGGVVGAPLPPPNIVTAPNPIQSTKVLEQITKLSIETANKLNRLEVVYTTNTRDAIQRDDTDRAEIKTRATL